MPSGLKTVVRRIRGMAGLPAIRDCSDRQLLERFAHIGEQAAFAALVERHGPLVLGVCRRVLRNAEDAEDACQATFMVLAKKAGSDFWQNSISNWLHSVAYRVALKTRSQRLRQRRRELTATPADATKENPTDQVTWGELRSVLDSELERLPRKYQAPLILCYLEGKTRDEAAAQLGWSAGSVKGRLERGRELLRRRLARRGLDISAVLCASLLPGAVSAMSAELATATLQNALAFSAGSTASATTSMLAQGVISAMLLTRIKLAAVMLLVVGILSFAALMMQPPLSITPPGRPATVVAATPKVEPKIDPPLVAAALPRPVAEDAVSQPKRRGVVLSVTPENGTLEVQLGVRQNTTVLLAQVDAATQFYLNERPHPLTLAQIPKDARVALQTAADGKTITHLHVTVPTASGVLEAVDNGTITLQDNGRSSTIARAADAVFRIGERQVDADELRPGMRVHLQLSLDQSAAVSVTAIAGERE